MIFIREQDPLKQGLKLLGYYHAALTFSIREQDPLKQGLKLAIWDVADDRVDYS